MPIASVSRVPFGQIPSATPVEPRASILSPVPEALETTAQKQAHAALVEFRAASGIADAGRDLSKLSVELLKPLDDLKKSKQVLDSNAIGINAIVTARQYARTIQTDGTPHGEYLDTLSGAVSQIERQALDQARRYGGAGVEHVATMLGNERLRLVSEGINYTVTRETGEQIGKLGQQDLLIRQELVQTQDPQRRKELTEQYLTIYGAAVASNLIKPIDAVKATEAFSLFAVENQAIIVGRSSGGIAAAERYLHGAGIPPDKQQEFLTNVLRDRSYDLRQKAEKEQEAVKTANATQDITEAKIRLRVLDKGVSIDELTKMRYEVVDMLEKKELRGTQEQHLQLLIDSKVQELTKPVKPVDNAETRNTLLTGVVLAPDATSERDITSRSDLTFETKTQLLTILKGRQQTAHYSNNVLFKRRVDELNSLKNMVDPYARIPQPGQTGIAPSNHALVEAYVSEYVLLVDKAATGTNGVLSSAQIAEFDDEFTAFKQAITDKKWPKSTPASTYYGQ